MAARFTSAMTANEPEDVDSAAVCVEEVQVGLEKAKVSTSTVISRFGQVPNCAAPAAWVSAKTNMKAQGNNRVSDGAS
jgi:hypothetical protein